MRGAACRSGAASFSARRTTSIDPSGPPSGIGLWLFVNRSEQPVSVQLAATDPLPSSDRTQYTSNSYCGPRAPWLGSSDRAGHDQRGRWIQWVICSVVVTVVSLSIALSVMTCFPEPSAAQQERPAFVIIERTATTGPEAIQQEYAKLAREILPKYGARYLARSQENTSLEGDGAVPCCIAILEFPSMDAVRHWYDSPENHDAAAVRQSGARFRIIAIQGIPPEK